MSYLIKSNQEDSHQSSSAAVLTVWSFVNRNTAKLKFNGDLSPAMKVSNPIMVVSDIISAKVSSTKGDYTSVAEIELSSGDLNYSAMFAPGDHAMLWMTNNVSEFKKVTEAVLANSPANHFSSGLKFVGRINSVREILSTEPGGKKKFRYLVTLKAFSEFSTYVFYNPLLDSVKNRDPSNVDRVLSQMSTEWNKIFINHTANGDDNISNIVSLLIKVFLGEGPGSEFQTIEKQIRSPNAGFLIPAAVLKVLGLPTSKQENAAGNKYSDMLHTLVGVQKYPKSESNSYKQFMPSNVDQKKSVGTTQVTLNDPVPGTVITPPQNFNNVTIWSLLTANANLTLNEMFCTLRTSFKDGRIMPTLVLRQIPFSSDPNNLNPNKKSDIKRYTRYLNLPRWEIDPDYPLMSYNLGTSDATRFNFFMCNSANIEREKDPQRSAQVQQFNNNNLFLDVMDIARNGLRSHFAMSTADVSKSGTALTDIVNWTNLVTDFYINGQYKQNGTIVLAGVQEPIAVGDNIQMDGRVFHIETVDHQYVTSGDGKKAFTTTLGLSHGVKTDGSFVTENVKTRAALKGDHLPGYTDEEVYADEKMIASTSEGRQTKISNDPPGDQPVTGSLVDTELEDKADQLRKNMGIA